MANPYVAFADPLRQEEAPRGARCSGQSLALLSLLVGVGCVALWSGGQHLAVQNSITAMALPPMPSARTSQFRGITAPVRSAQDTLKKFGMGPSPLETLVLSAIDANNRGTGMRNVAMMASNMDAKTQVMMADADQAVQLKAQDLAGVNAPTGFFDPLGFSTDIPAGTLLFFREVELKHGRVGMLASLGIAVGEVFHPLFGGNIDGPAAFAFQQTPLQSFWPVVLLAMGVIESSSILTFEQPWDRFSGFAIKKGWSMKTDRLPGDLGYDPLGLKPKDPKKFLDMQNKELNNGRLAMLGAAGMLAQELATGEKTFG